MTMTVTGWAQILIFLAIIVAITPLLGAYMLRVFNGERTFLSPVLRPVEIAIHKISGIDERQEQHAAVYTVGMLLFQIGGFFILYVLMRAQA
jgi:potassium-transporting ATPase potassium-binding subunit